MVKITHTMLCMFYHNQKYADESPALDRLFGGTQYCISQGHLDAAAAATVGTTF